MINVASPMKRIGAYVIDILIVLILVQLLSMCFPTSAKTNKQAEDYLKLVEEMVSNEKTSDENMEKLESLSYDISKSGVVQSGVAIGLYFVYFVVIQTYNNGQTLGKRLLKIRTVDSKTKDKPKFLQIFIRSLFIYSILSNTLDLLAIIVLNKSHYLSISNYISSLYIIVLFICFITILRSDRIGLHDKFAHTLVIDDEEEEEENTKSKQWNDNINEINKKKSNPRLKNHTSAKEKK